MDKRCLTYLGSQTLEEGRDTLVLHQILHNCKPANLLLKVRLLDTSLHDIEGRRDGDTGDSTGHGGDEVLAPGSLRVVGNTENVVLGEGGGTKEGERTGSVTRHRPSPAAVEGGTLLSEDTEETSATEGFGVDLALNLEDVKREEDLLHFGEPTSSTSGAFRSKE